MNDVEVNGITYPEPQWVEFPGKDGKPVRFDIPKPPEKVLNGVSTNPPETRAVFNAIAAEAAARAATDEEIHRHLTSPYNFKGALASASDLPAASAANANDTYYLIAEKYRVTSNGTAWEQSSMDEGDYADELAELNGALTDITEDVGYISVTPDISKTISGVNISTDGNLLILWGTATATRNIGFVNGNNFTKASTDSFTKTLPAGKYAFAFQQSGAQLTGSIRGSYSTFANSFSVVSSADAGRKAVTLESDAMLGYQIINGRNYGTADSPTYVSLQAYKVTANDWMMRKRFDELTVNPTAAVMSAITQATVDGITLTRLTDTSFSLSGQPAASGYSKLFNIINGVSACGRTSAEAVFTPNILAPGTYTLRFRTSRSTSNSLFVLFPGGGTWADRRYLDNGDTFEVEQDNPVTLCIYGGSHYNYNNELIVDFWLERNGYEIKQNSAVDVYGRYLIEEIKSTGANVNTDDIIKMLSASVCNLAYAVDADGHELFRNGGALNAYRKAMQAVNITWVNTDAIPDRYSEPDIQPGSHKGMIYSSVKEKEKYVFLDVSLTTFMTALRNPYSLLYTEDVDANENKSAYGFSYNGINCGAYYGIVCSAFVGYAVGWGVRWETQDFDYLRRKGILVELADASADSVQRFDIMWQSGHTRLVTEITRDDYGVPVSIVVSESTGLAHSTTYSKAGFDGYIARHNCKLYRYVDLYKNTSYEASPFVAVLNEDPDEYVYNDDICTFAGDYACFCVGDTVHINYAKGSYTSMIIAAGGQVLHTISLPAAYNDTHSVDITELNLGAGLYTAYLTNGTAISEPTHFEMIDAATTAVGDINNLTVEFNKSAHPCYLELADNQGITHGKYVLTDADIVAGEVTLDFNRIAYDMYGKTYAAGNYLRCIYQGQYGRVINEPIQIN